MKTIRLKRLTHFISIGASAMASTKAANAQSFHSDNPADGSPRWPHEDPTTEQKLNTVKK